MQQLYFTSRHNDGYNIGYVFSKFSLGLEHFKYIFIEREETFKSPKKISQIIMELQVLIDTFAFYYNMANQSMVLFTGPTFTKILGKLTSN